MRAMRERWGKARVESEGEWEQMGGGLVTEELPPPFRGLALVHVKVSVKVSVKVKVNVRSERGRG